MRYTYYILFLFIISGLHSRAQLVVQLTTTQNVVCNGFGCNYVGPSILINEVMTKPTTGNGSIYGTGPNSQPQSGEWIELYNPDQCKPVDISCYFLGNNAPDDGGNWGGGFELPAGTIVPARGFVVVRGINAPAVPANLLLANGGRTVEVIVNTGNSVCIGGGFRLWFPDSGGWFAFYDRDGVPQDAISWNSTTNSLMNGNPCNPPGNCPFTGQLPSYVSIPASRKTYIDNGNASTGLSYKRNPDGGAWVINTQSAATYGNCNATCVPQPPITCTGTATVNVSGGTPPYTYSWNDGQAQITMTATGLCEGTYCVTVTDVNLESTVACVTVNNFEPAVATGILPLEICKDQSPIVLTGGTPVGGTYSGPGVSAGIFYPLLGNIGVNIITYSWYNPDSCFGSSTTTISVFEKPIVTVNAIPGICVTAPPVGLSGGSPAGGTFSGPGVTNGMFDPSLTGVGTFTLKYKVVVTGGCSDSINQTITVFPLPFVSLGVQAPACVNYASVFLSGGNPVGGTFSGTGVTGDSLNPAVAGVGQTVITYTYTDSNTCVNEATTNFTVFPLPVVTLASQSPICLNAPPVSIFGGLPFGGTYSGPGITGNTFNPANAGLGIQTLTYTFTDLNNCTNSGTNTITVFPLPTIQFGPVPPACDNVTSFTITSGLPPGGTYSGPGVTTGVFNPSAAGIGVHQLTYSYTDASGCTNSANQNVTVFGPPSVSQLPFDSICLSATPLALSGGAPTGGTYSGTGISGNVFDPAIADTGYHTITYSWADSNTCVGDTQVTIFVVPPPTVSQQPLSNICANADSIPLSGGAPGGGVYSGPGVVSNYFNPKNTPTGNQTITYTYTDPQGCSNSVNTIIFVQSLTPVGQLSFPIICEDADPITLIGGNPLGGTYSGPGVTSGIFDPVPLGAGTYPITYSFLDQNNCTNDTIRQLVVSPLPTPFQVTGGGIICDAGDGTIIGLTNSEIGVEYQLILNGQLYGFPYTGTGLPFSFGTKSDSGTYQIQAVNQITGCANVMNDSAYVTYIYSPKVKLADSTWLCDDAGIMLDAGGYLPDTVFYTWQNGSSERYFKVTEPGIYWVSVGKNNCFGTDSILIKPCSELWIPNVFTPNGDGKNERFLPKVTGDVIDYKVMVFNRWGKQVYESIDLEEGWDGTNFNNGSECNDGTYFYVIYYKGLGRGEPPSENKLTGSVTLLR